MGTGTNGPYVFSYNMCHIGILLSKYQTMPSQKLDTKA
jgi:hypothetical protein